MCCLFDVLSCCRVVVYVFVRMCVLYACVVVCSLFVCMVARLFVRVLAFSVCVFVFVLVRLRVCFFV